MAEAAAKRALGTISLEHLECSICCCCFTEPKVLDCLHSFCLNCLEELIGSQQTKTDHITCPVCRRETAIPDHGVQDLSSCLVHSSLVDEVKKQKRLLEDASKNSPTCEECDDGLEAVSRCFDCDSNICQKCLDTHQKMKSTRKHLIVNLSQSENELLIDLRKNDTPHCTKHKNQELCFYCETCKTLACAKCAASEHRAVQHEYVEVADAIRQYRRDVNEILQKFETSRREFDLADDSLEHARKRLKIMVDRACMDITCQEQQQITVIKNKSRVLRAKVEQLGEKRQRKFEEVRNCNCNKLKQAEKIVATVKDLMQQADDFELLELKPKVMQNLQLQEELRPEQAQHDLSFIAVERHNIVSDSDIGKVLEQEEWTALGVFGDFECASDVACLSNGDVVVIDTETREIMIFTSDGWEYTQKTSVDSKKLQEPHAIAVTCNDMLLVIDGKHVKTFDSNLELVNQFQPMEGAEGNTNSDLGDIAVDRENRIVIAHPRRGLITLHNLDGSLITTISHDKVGLSLAVGVENRLIFINSMGCSLTCITYSGDELFSIHTTLDGEPRDPSGVCCDDAGDIYVIVSESICHYSPEGVLIGRTTTHLLLPFELTFAPCGDLVVADERSVKILKRV